MKSKVLFAKDYRSILLERKNFIPDEAELQREIQRLANPYIYWADGDKAANGDMIICNLRSDCLRFQRENMRLIIGSGMFHSGLESHMVGMRLGESRRVALPEAQVEITVISIKNKIVPDIDDKMAAGLGLEGVRTVEDYRNYLRHQQKESYLEETVSSLLYTLTRAVIDDSEFVIRKEDWRTVVELELNRCRVIAAQEGMVLEEMMPEQFEGRIPVKTYDGLVALIQNEAWDMLRSSLLGRLYAESDSFTVDAGTYEVFIRNYCEQQNENEEDVYSLYPYEGYKLKEYRKHFYDVLGRYIRESILQEKV